MKIDIGYNWQGNNPNFDGKFSGWIQCMTTSIWMAMSRYTDAIKADDDAGLALYLDDVEATIGKPGIAEAAIRKYNWITGRTSQWWLVQKEGMEKWLWKNGVKGEAVFYNKTMTFGKMIEILSGGDPVAIGTQKIGGLSGGHIILVVGFEGEDFICKDPAGNATTKYKNPDGNDVVYPMEYLKKFTGENFYALHWNVI